MKCEKGSWTIFSTFVKYEHDNKHFKIHTIMKKFSCI